MMTRGIYCLNSASQMSYAQLCNYDNKHFTSCERGARGKWGDEGKVTLALKII